MSARAMLMSPQITSRLPVAWDSRTNASSASRNRIFASKSLPPFGTYTDAIVRSGDLGGHDAALVVKARVREGRPFGAQRLADVQADTQYPLAPCQ